MTTKHTPGPWQEGNCSGSGRIFKKWGIYGASTNDRPKIATVEENASTETEHANARLIAAAPELAEALQNAANVLAALATGQLKGITKDSKALKMARAALQRAGLVS